MGRRKKSGARLAGFDRVDKPIPAANLLAPFSNKSAGAPAKLVYGFGTDSVFLRFGRLSRFANSQPILPSTRVSDASNGLPFLEMKRRRRSLLPSVSIFLSWSGAISLWRIVLLTLKVHAPLGTFSQT